MIKYTNTNNNIYRYANVPSCNIKYNFKPAGLTELQQKERMLPKEIINKGKSQQYYELAI